MFQQAPKIIGNYMLMQTLRHQIFTECLISRLRCLRSADLAFCAAAGTAPVLPGSSLWQRHGEGMSSLSAPCSGVVSWEHSPGSLLAVAAVLGHHPEHLMPTSPKQPVPQRFRGHQSRCALWVGRDSSKPWGPAQLTGAPYGDSGRNKCLLAPVLPCRGR